MDTWYKEGETEPWGYGLVEGKRKKPIFDEVIAITKTEKDNNICLASSNAKFCWSPVFFSFFSLRTHYNFPPIQSASFFLSMSLSCFLSEMSWRLEEERREHCIMASLRLR